MKVKRYDLVGDYALSIGELEDGDYDLADDYEALLALARRFREAWKYVEDYDGDDMTLEEDSAWLEE